MHDLKTGNRVIGCFFMGDFMKENHEIKFVDNETCRRCKWAIRKEIIKELQKEAGCRQYKQMKKINKRALR